MAAGAERRGAAGSKQSTTGQMLAGCQAGQLCGLRGSFHLQQNKMEGEKSEKEALNSPSPALTAERSKFMSAPDIH